MSNTVVGNIYLKIMEDVINGCIVTFEEEGVEKKLLDEVKAAKLSEQQVALMPWDPPTTMPPQQAQAPATSSQSNRPQQSTPSQSSPQSSTPTAMQQPPVQASNGGPQIKSEPGTGYDLQNLPQMNPPGLARERAQQHVNARIAEQQQAGINAHAAAQRPGLPKMAPPTAQQTADDQRRMQQVQMMASNNAMQQKLSQQRQQGSVGNAQMDGANDWASFVAERRSAFIEGAAEADATIKQRIESRSREMEGGGLLMPISESKTRRTTIIIADTDHGISSAQADGPGDVDVKAEDDEDAINSDLDDPDDDQIEDAEDDGGPGEMMLCTYDKVQRVKNKWKCTLKDGILATGGKEYVFHKAQGEFEW